jgi:hypothetical protein
MVVKQAAAALVEAANIYKNQDARALSKGENYDGFVKVDLPGGHWLPIDQLGDACSIAKRTVGKLNVVAFQTTGEVFVRQLASGDTHGGVVVEVIRVISTAVDPFSRPPQVFVASAMGGLYGGFHLITAPDVTVQSFGDINGQRMGDSEFGPLFFAEVEHGNRSLLELIRHLGLLLANFPNLNGVLGIKGEKDTNGNKTNALILIECRTVAGVRQRHVTQLVDFGPHPYTDIKKRNVNHALTLPLPAIGEEAQPGEHGTGAVDPLPEWTRFDSGMDGDNPAIIPISPTLLLAGAHSTGDNGAIINIPAAALPANIDLAFLVYKYS